MHMYLSVALVSRVDHEVVNVCRINGVYLTAEVYISVVRVIRQLACL